MRIIKIGLSSAELREAVREYVRNRGFNVRPDEEVFFLPRKEADNIEGAEVPLILIDRESEEEEDGPEAGSGGEREVDVKREPLSS